MKIAAVVIAHDVVDWVREAIESALGQSRRPDLVVIVENGSRDGTAEEIRRALRDLQPPDGLVRTLHEERLGPSGARNLGAEVAIEEGAEALGFLDGDDWWSPGFLEATERVLRADPVAPAVFAWTVVRGEAGRFRGLRARARGGYDYSDLCWFKSPMVTASALTVRADAFIRSGGFRQDISLGEDWELLLRLTREGGSVRCARRFAVNYRKRPRSLTSDASGSKVGLEAIEAAHPAARHAKHWWWPLNQALQAGDWALVDEIVERRPAIGPKDLLSPQFIVYLVHRARAGSRPGRTLPD